MNKDMIRLKVDLNSWEEAIKFGGELLQKAGYIENEYIEKMIENVKKNGSYIVVAPGIAMPHAKADEYVLKNGVSIVTPKVPLSFGHDTNDPVKLIITLASIDPNIHLEIIQDVVTLLSNHDAIAMIEASNDSNEVIQLINTI